MQYSQTLYKNRGRWHVGPARLKVNSAGKHHTIEISPHDVSEWPNGPRDEPCRVTKLINSISLTATESGSDLEAR